MKYSRWISALFGAPLVILILVLGNVYVIDIAFAIIAAISLYEYFNSFKEKAKPVIWIGYLFSALIVFNLLQIFWFFFDTLLLHYLNLLQ